jgi:hypothetical protein
MKMIKKFLFFLATTLVIANVYAVPILWTVNGHSYDFIRTNIDWFNAFVEADSLGGYLATITFSEENEFIRSNFYTGNIDFAWIGGYEPEDNGIWLWGTGPEADTQFSYYDAATAPYYYDNWGGAE